MPAEGTLLQAPATVHLTGSGCWGADASESSLRLMGAGPWRTAQPHRRIGGKVGPSEANSTLSLRPHWDPGRLPKAVTCLFIVTPCIYSWPFPLSIPHSSIDVSWDLLRNQLLALESLIQGLLLGEPSLGQSWSPLSQEEDSLPQYSLATFSRPLIQYIMVYLVFIKYEERVNIGNT